MYYVKYSLLSGVTSSVLPRGYVNRIRNLAAKERSLLRRSDWPSRVWAYDVRTRIDR